MKCQPNLKQRCATFASPTMPLPLENLTLVSSFHRVFELSLDKLKTMLQAKFGGEGGGGGGHKLLTLNLYQVRRMRRLIEDYKENSALLCNVHQPGNNNSLPGKKARHRNIKHLSVLLDI